MENNRADIIVSNNRSLHCFSTYLAKRSMSYCWNASTFKREFLQENLAFYFHKGGKPSAKFNKPFSLPLALVLFSLFVTHYADTLARTRVKKYRKHGIYKTTLQTLCRAVFVSLLIFYLYLLFLELPTAIFFSCVK